MSFIPVIGYAVNAYRAAETAEAASSALHTLAWSSTAETAYWGASIYGANYLYHQNDKMPIRRITPTGNFARKRLRTGMQSNAAKLLASRQQGARGRQRAKTNYLNRRTGGLIGRFQPSSGATELKFLDTSMVIATSATAATFATSPTVIVQGTGATQRVGLGVTIKSVQLRGRVVYDPGTSSAGAETMYMYLVLDKECNGERPDASGTNGIFTDADLSVAHMNIGNSSRFMILKKWVFNFNTMTRVPAGSDINPLRLGDMSYPIEYYSKVDFPVKWQSNNSDGVLDGQTKNAIWLVTGSSHTQGTITVTGNMRVRFNDHC